MRVMVGDRGSLPVSLAKKWNISDNLAQLARQKQTLLYHYSHSRRTSPFWQSAGRPGVLESILPFSGPIRLLNRRI